MTDEYLTGIESIDEQHRKLFDIANRAYEVLQNEFLSDKYDSIQNLLHELREYTKYHFNFEENYMESINYKRMFTQKIQHANFIDKIEKMELNDLDENQDKAILDILDFLVEWLKTHILETDKLIAE